jgi:D-glycero-D-manno-heptose 1,7-bisphosphate phosphatase
MLYIFDKDNTLVFSYPGRPANSVTEQRLLPGVAEKCARLRQAGHYLAIASNQGGIASGKITLSAVGEMMGHLANLIQADSYRYCPHSSWRNECNCRKPKPGMILSLMNQFDISRHGVVFVGDADTDKAAAEAAGVKFEWACEFFGWPEGFNTILEDI